MFDFGDSRILARFWDKAQATPGGCWVWTAANNGRGYGTLGIPAAQRTGSQRMAYAHRYFYEQLVGPIPDGLVVDHLCRNRSCVNPLHLEPVTHQTNLLRGMTVTARNAAATRCPWGHEYTPENTYRTAKGHRLCRACTLERQRRRDAIRPPRITSKEKK